MDETSRGHKICSNDAGHQNKSTLSFWSSSMHWLNWLDFMLTEVWFSKITDLQNYSELSSRFFQSFRKTASVTKKSRSGRSSLEDDSEKHSSRTQTQELSACRATGIPKRVFINFRQRLSFIHTCSDWRLPTHLQKLTRKGTFHSLLGFVRFCRHWGCGRISFFSHCLSMKIVTNESFRDQGRITKRLCDCRAD